MNSRLFSFALLAALSSASSVVIAQDSAEATPEKTATGYAGVVVTEVAPPLAQHLELAEGFGLQVEYVVKASPAAEAGVKRHDVLSKVGDQRLTTPKHFAILVRSFEPETEIELTVLRKGVEVKLPLTVGEQPEFLRKAVEDHVRRLEEMTALRNSEPDSATAPSIQISGTIGVVKIDNEHGEVTMTDLPDGHGISVKDENGKTVYEGPYDPEKGSAGLPKEAQEHLKKMNLGDLKKLTPKRPTVTPPIELGPNGKTDPEPDSSTNEEKEVL